MKDGNGSMNTRLTRFVCSHAYQLWGAVVVTSVSVVSGNVFQSMIGYMAGITVLSVIERMTTH